MAGQREPCPQQSTRGLVRLPTLPAQARPAIWRIPLPIWRPQYQGRVPAGQAPQLAQADLSRRPAAAYLHCQPCCRQARHREGDHELRERPRPAARSYPRPRRRSGADTVRDAAQAQVRSSPDRPAQPMPARRRIRNTPQPGAQHLLQTGQVGRSPGSTRRSAAFTARCRADANSAEALAGSPLDSIMPKVVRASASASPRAGDRQRLVAPAAANLVLPTSARQRLGGSGA